MNIEWCLMISICLNSTLCSFKGMKDKCCVRMMMNSSLFSLHYFIYFTLTHHSVSLPTTLVPTCLLLHCLTKLMCFWSSKKKTKPRTPWWDITFPLHSSWTELLLFTHSQHGICTIYYLSSIFYYSMQHLRECYSQHPQQLHSGLLAEAEVLVEDSL